jgi:hypothetical protein
MSQKTKTIIKETEEVSEHDNPAVLAYRVGQLEIKQEKGFAELKEQNGAQIKMISDLAHNFASKSDLQSAQREGDAVHEVLDKRLGKVEGWLTWAARIILGAVLAAVLGLVIVTKGQI